MPTPTKTVLITGAARRIGAHLARYLHQQGFNILIHYHRSSQAAFDLAAQLNQQRSDSARTFAADLNDTKQLKVLIEEAQAAYGRLDVLINNASRFYPTKLKEVNLDTWQDLMASNLQAPFFLAQAAQPYLQQSQGCIINITDIHAQRPLKGYPIYSIAKAGLAMLTLSLAKELAPAIRVNAIAPGPIMLPEGESNHLSAEQQTALIEKTALKKWGSPEEIAKATLYLIQADYVTGQTIMIDGGRSLNL